jgi:hypothetical protein
MKINSKYWKKLTKYWMINIIALGLLSLFIAYTIPMFAWLVVNGFLFIFIGIIALIAPYTIDGKKRAEKYKFRETTTEKNCKNCTCFDMNSFNGFEGNCKYFKIKTDENHVCNLF